MTDPFEKQLKDALRRKEPAPGFMARVNARVEQQEQRRWSTWLRPIGVRWAMVVLVIAMVGGVFVERERERRREEGEAAKRQVMIALKIAGSKLRVAQVRVRQMHETTSGRE